MKHWWKTLIMGSVCCLTATLFVACGPKLSATTNDENAAKSSSKQISEPIEIPTIKEPNKQPTINIQQPTTNHIHEHQYGDWEITEPATCTKQGRKIRRCTCGDTEEQTLPATDHHHVCVEEVDPTCTENGYRVFHCPDCGDTYQKPTTEAYGHKTEEYVNTPPTCDTAGRAVKHCTRCDQDIEEVVIQPTGKHEYMPVTIQAPTCNQTGTIIYRCHCGAVEPDHETVIPTTNHQYNPHTHLCHCGAQQPPLENLQGSYWRSNDNKFVISFETCEAISDQQFTGKYTSYQYNQDTGIGKSFAENYAGTYTLTFSNFAQPSIHFDNTANNTYNLQDYNTLTYSEIDYDDTITYQLTGILFKITKNYTLTFMGYEVQ